MASKHEWLVHVVPILSQFVDWLGSIWCPCSAPSLSTAVPSGLRATLVAVAAWDVRLSMGDECVDGECVGKLTMLVSTIGVVSLDAVPSIREFTASSMCRDCCEPGRPELTPIRVVSLHQSEVSCLDLTQRGSH